MTKSFHETVAIGNVASKLSNISSILPQTFIKPHTIGMPVANVSVIKLMATRKSEQSLPLVSSLFLGHKPANLKPKRFRFIVHIKSIKIVWNISYLKKLYRIA